MWDNDTNPYYKIKLHRYTNIQNNDISLPALKESLDIDIPMTRCDKMIEFEGGWDLSAPHYCPEYKATDIFKGNYFTDKYSWLRLAVHRCDPTEIIGIGD